MVVLRQISLLPHSLHHVNFSTFSFARFEHFGGSRVRLSVRKQRGPFFCAEEWTLLRTKCIRTFLSWTRVWQTSEQSCVLDGMPHTFLQCWHFDAVLFVVAHVIRFGFFPLHIIKVFLSLSLPSPLPLPHGFHHSARVSSFVHRLVSQLPYELFISILSIYYFIFHRKIC